MKVGEAERLPFFRNTGEYFQFYWPLATMALVVLVGTQVSVAVLARYPEGVQELANFAVAAGIVTLCQAVLMFTPQLVNVYGESFASRRQVARFVAIVGVCATAPFAFLAWTDWGGVILEFFFGRPETGLPVDVVQAYLKWYTPVLIFEGFRGYHMGLLIRAKRTGIVSLLNIASLVFVTTFLLVGFWSGYGPRLVIGGSALVAAGFSLAITWWADRRYGAKGDLETDSCPTLTELRRFFVPLSITTFFFAISRPILIAYASRTADPEILIASSRVAFEMGFILIAPLNQFRNLYVTFGRIDLRGVRNFSVLVLISIVTIVFLALVTPAARFLFGTVYGLEEPVLTMVIQSLWVLLLIPFILTVRNYYHGVCMLNKVTGRMGVAGLVRMGLILVAGYLLLRAEVFNQWTMPGVLVAGFFIETLTVWLIFQYHGRRGKGGNGELVGGG